MRLRIYGFVPCLLCTTIFLSASGYVTAQERFESLFDGETFRGWEGDKERSFRIEESAIKAGSLEREIPRNEFLCTKREFSDFELRLKFKLLGERTNAGVQIRTRRIPNHHEVIGYQADLGNPAWWGSLYDESRRRTVLAQADADAVNRILKREDWNDYVIRATARRIQLWINGHQTVDYTEPDSSIEQSGLICVQIHSGPPGEAWYKDIQVMRIR